MNFKIKQIFFFNIKKLKTLKCPTEIHRSRAADGRDGENRHGGEEEGRGRGGGVGPDTS